MNELLSSAVLASQILCSEHQFTKIFEMIRGVSFNGVEVLNHSKCDISCQTLVPDLEMIYSAEAPQKRTSANYYAFAGPFYNDDTSSSKNFSDSSKCLGKARFNRSCWKWQWIH